MTTLKNCVVCAGSVQCLKCENFELKAEIRALRQEILKYNMDKSEVFQVSRHAEIEIYSKVLRYQHPIEAFNLPTDDSIIKWRFLTLTFDPLKFGIQPYEQDRKAYILYKLLRSVHKNIIDDFYGCFEYHESGLIHAHMVINTDYNDKFIEDYFQPEFTDNRRNKRAVKCLPAKTTVLDYIHKVNTPDKRSDDFFKYNKNSLLRNKKLTSTPKSRECFQKHERDDEVTRRELGCSNEVCKPHSYGPSDTYREMFGQKLNKNI